MVVRGLTLDQEAIKFTVPWCISQHWEEGGGGRIGEEAASRVYCMWCKPASIQRDLFVVCRREGGRDRGRDEERQG